MRLVRLTRADNYGEPIGDVWVNPDHVRTVTTFRPHTATYIGFGALGGYNDSIEVAEDIDTVIARLSGQEETAPEGTA